MAWTEEKRRESGENVERDRGRSMKRRRHEENDRTAEKKRWRLGEWRKSGLVVSERERPLLWDLYKL